ncbi:class A beta-lactamase [Rhodanobacter sp. DHG33]|uniref:class A beta-lactamase n=1 Tax=Rhodanobacter sp. DHG33 TaxID=2775921 RepID=UPI001780B0A8|nr:class A beta-lactamase [Rhodanobacter sp. DHG33]MBD8899637.1 class A beta-lactamase [Rhodanobacter sp. DHG33]
MHATRTRLSGLFALTLALIVPTVLLATPATDAHATHAALQAKLEALATRAQPGVLGIAVLDPQSGERWRVNAERAYPMMSVFKAAVAAAVFARIDRGELSMTQTVTLTRADIVDGSAVPSIGAHFHGDRMNVTVSQLLTAAVSESDSTAVDALLRLVPPQDVTAFLRAHGIAGMRVDTGEAGVSRVFEQLAPGQQPPADETAQAQELRLQRGYRAYLADRRNRSTPDAAADFLRQLQRGALLSPASTRALLALLQAQTQPNRMRQGVPGNVRFADKCGTSYTLDGLTAAYNDIGILTWPDGRSVIVAAFLTVSTASKAEREALFADLARTVAATWHH